MTNVRVVVKSSGIARGVFHSESSTKRLVSFTCLRGRREIGELRIYDDAEIRAACKNESTVWLRFCCTLG